MREAWTFSGRDGNARCQTDMCFFFSNFHYYHLNNENPMKWRKNRCFKSLGLIFMFDNHVLHHRSTLRNHVRSWTCAEYFSERSGKYHILRKFAGGGTEIKILGRNTAPNLSLCICFNALFAGPNEPWIRWMMGLCRFRYYTHARQMHHFIGRYSVAIAQFSIVFFSPSEKSSGVYFEMRENVSNRNAPHALGHLHHPN